MIGGTGAVIVTSEPHLQSLCNLQGGYLSWDFMGPENCHHRLVSAKARCHFMEQLYKYSHSPSTLNLFCSRQHFQRQQNIRGVAPTQFRGRTGCWEEVSDSSNGGQTIHVVLDLCTYPQTTETHTGLESQPWHSLALHWTSQSLYWAVISSCVQRWQK